jgi:hypothetical protein
MSEGAGLEGRNRSSKMSENVRFEIPEELRALAEQGLVVRFQHSHATAATSFANVGIEGPLAKIRF